MREIPSISLESDAFSKDLKRRGFSFVGSTIIYSHMQAVGMVNDHLVDCFRYREIRQLDCGGTARVVKQREHREMARPSVKKRTPKTRSGHQPFALPFHDTHGIPSEIRDETFAEVIRSIPRGKVASYGQVAAAAGYPRYHRAVARLLKTTIAGELPWQRVLGAGGEIKLAGRAAAEQRLRLRMEGVTFVGRRIDLNLHQHVFELE